MEQIKEGKQRNNLIILGVVAIVGIVAMVFGYMSSNKSYLVSDEFLYDDTEISAAASAPLSKCFDSDGGKNYNTVGFVKIGRHGRAIWDFCNSNTELIEYYCVGNNRKSTKYICPNGCQYGACITPPPTNITKSCTDTDSGFKPFTKGTIFGFIGNNFFNNTDFCISNDELTEFFCSGNEPSSSFFNCKMNNTNICVNGACTSPPPPPTNQTNTTNQTI